MGAGQVVWRAAATPEQAGMRTGVWTTKAPTSTTDPLSTDPVRAVTSQPQRLTDKDVAPLRFSVVSGSCGPR